MWHQRRHSGLQTHTLVTKISAVCARLCFCTSRILSHPPVVQHYSFINKVDKTLPSTKLWKGQVGLQISANSTSQTVYTFRRLLVNVFFTSATAARCELYLCAEYKHSYTWKVRRRCTDCVWGYCLTLTWTKACLTLNRNHIKLS